MDAKTGRGRAVVFLLLAVVALDLKTRAGGKRPGALARARSHSLTSQSRLLTAGRSGTLRLRLRGRRRRRRAGCRRCRRTGSLGRLLAATEALQPLDLQHMRHEDGVGRVAGQLRTDGNACSVMRAMRWRRMRFTPETPFASSAAHPPPLSSGWPRRTNDAPRRPAD